MPHFSKSTLLTLAFGISTSLIALNAQAALTPNSKVVITGIGDVRVGMTVAEAARAAGTELVSGEDRNAVCHYVTPKSGVKGMGFMVIRGKIARVDVWDNRQITTLRGAKIGDSEARIKALYPKQIQVSQHAYRREGHYLTFVPKDKSDRNYRVVFETDGRKVTSFHAGKLPEVEYVEGCS